MNSLVTTDLKSTSRIIAEHFGKRHDNVLRQIDNLVRDLGGKTDEFCVLNFEEDVFKEVFVNSTEDRRVYTLSEEATLMLIGRMTGAGAAQKQKLVAQAFIAMKRHIKDQRLSVDKQLQAQLEHARDKVVAYEHLLGNKPNTLAKLLGIAPSKSRPYFEKLEALGVVESLPKVIHGFAYKPTTAGMQYVAHIDKNGIIHWTEDVTKLLA